MPKTTILLRRLAAGAVTIFAAASMNFLLFHLAPGDPTSRLRSIPGITDQEIRGLRTRYGLDQSLLTQYLDYLKRLARLDLGQSYADGQPVWGHLWEAYVNTVPLVIAGVGLALAGGVVFGVVAAWRRATWADHLTVGTGLATYALPAQWIGLMLLLVFAGRLPSGGRSDEFLVAPGFVQHQLDIGRHLILPAATLAISLFGQYLLIVRSSVLETLGEDYILTARAKGLRTGRILRAHALRNALLPLSTLVALSLSFVVSGSILVETVFSWPGIGRAVAQAAFARDWPMLQGAFLLFTATVVTLNLIVDVVYLRLDPRITE